MYLTTRPFRSAKLKLDSAACLLCQWRTFSASTTRFEEKPAKPSSVPEVLKDAPRARGKAVEDFTPKPLNRPIGLPNPPSKNDYTGVDTRTLKQRRDDFVNYEKHIARRKELTEQISTPYFREWSNMRLHKGKSFIAPPGIFKAERALYFPNFFGQTLEKDKKWRDTTTVLENKISVVSIFSSKWAEDQAATFVSEKASPELHEVVKKSNGKAQMVQINIEDDFLKHAIIKLFMGSLRMGVGIDNWGRYFLIKKSIPLDARDAIGFLNSKVGYTYLVDGDCKIRWGGSGIAQGDEKDGLVRGVRRLIEDSKSNKKAPLPQATESDKPVPGEKVSQPAA